MSSYHHLLPQTNRRAESPARVFAKLKSKVQRDVERGICANEGIFTGSDPLCNGKEKRGNVFKSPKKRADSTWMTSQLNNENLTSGCYPNEAQALTLSPISSPRKIIGYLYPDTSSAHVEAPVTETRHACTPTKRAFLESTAVHHPSSRDNRTPVIGDSGGFQVTSRTPVKMQPVGNDFASSSVFGDGCAPQDKRMSPAYMLSPTRMRKRKWEPQDSNKVISSTKEVNNECIRQQPQDRTPFSAFREDNSTCMGNIRGFSADPSEPVAPSLRSTAMKRCDVSLEKVPLMSPAKMFAYMKQRERETELPEVHKVKSSTRNLFGHLHQSRDTASSTAHNVGEVEDIALSSVPESAVVPVKRSRVQSANIQSNGDPSEDVPSPAVSPPPVLLEDALVLNTPEVSIPKKREAVFKRKKWPQQIKFPSENMIYLQKWFLRKNHQGLFVDGIHRDKNIQWHSNLIMERVSNSVVKTVSGSVYILVGMMNTSVDSDFPKWLLKKFAHGFPQDWKALYEKFLSEANESNSSRETERNYERKGVISKTISETPSIHSVKQHRQKPTKTRNSCPSAYSSCSTVSRSGRTIKPPLEYWKGGRVILDAQMNVTIHEGYNTSICIPVNTTVSVRTSECSEGRKQRKSPSDKEASVPLRKVKAPLRKCDRAKVRPAEKPSYSSEPPVETRSSSEDWSGRRTRSRQRRPATEQTLYVDTVPQKQSEPEKSSTQRSVKQRHDGPEERSGRPTRRPAAKKTYVETVPQKQSEHAKTQRSKKQMHDTTRTSVRILERKRAVLASPESVNDTTSASTDDEVIRRKKTGKEVHSRGSKRVNKSRPSYVFPPSDSSRVSEESENELRERTRVTQIKHKQSKRSNSSSPTKPLPELTRSSKKPKADKGNVRVPQEQDADEWTGAELMKLQEAVSYYPKHLAGYWAKVAKMVGTRSAEECHSQHTSRGTSQTPAKKPKKPRKPKKEKVEAPKDPDPPVISARVGTLRRKQQVRQFLEAMPREDVEDIFSSAAMQNKCFEMPSMCPSDHDINLSDMEPLTPKSTAYPEVKTPQCLHITPGMMGSPNRTNDDKYIYQLQKRMKKNQFNVCKQAAPSKSFSPTPTVKRTMRRCGNTENDTFVIWEMFPGKDDVLPESGDEEDFYFSDDN